MCAVGDLDLRWRAVPHEYLSEDQTVRYRRFVDDPSPGELELFFRMDAATLEHVRSKRRPHNRLGWSVQWGTVRMLGTFLPAPGEVPDVVARFVAEQLGIDDASCLKLYPDRFADPARARAGDPGAVAVQRVRRAGAVDLRSYVASRVWNSVESRRALFDRAMVWMLRERVLLPGISVLSRLVTEVRAGEYERIYGLIAAAPPDGVDGHAGRAACGARGRARVGVGTVAQDGDLGQRPGAQAGRGAGGRGVRVAGGRSPDKRLIQVLRPLINHVPAGPGSARGRAAAGREPPCGSVMAMPASSPPTIRGSHTSRIAGLPCRAIS